MRKHFYTKVGNLREKVEKVEKLGCIVQQCMVLNDTGMSVTVTKSKACLQQSHKFRSGNLQLSE